MDICPQFIYAFVLCPAKLWSLRSLPTGVMEQRNLCPASSLRYSFRGPNNHKENLGLIYIYIYIFFCKAIFLKHYHFRDIHNHCDHFLRNTYFAGRYQFSILPFHHNTAQRSRALGHFLVLMYNFCYTHVFFQKPIYVFFFSQNCSQRPYLELDLLIKTFCRTYS